MKKTEIEKKVKKIIAEKLAVKQSKIKTETSLINNLGADSLDIIELIMEFEKEFNISIPDKNAEKIKTVGDIVKYLTKNDIK